MTRRLSSPIGRPKKQIWTKKVPRLRARGPQLSSPTRRDKQWSERPMVVVVMVVVVSSILSLSISTSKGTYVDCAFTLQLLPCLHSVEILRWLLAYTAPASEALFLFIKAAPKPRNYLIASARSSSSICRTQHPHSP
jgi:hypothetical protein